VVDAVCSVASEEIRFDEWDLDVVLTASQKGLGTPPGLSILVASQRALEVCRFYRTDMDPLTHSSRFLKIESLLLHHTMHPGKSGCLS